jgi:hypothetical protein
MIAPILDVVTSEMLRRGSQFQFLGVYYAPQFVTAVRDARVHSVMASYNAVNGVPASAKPACILFAAASEALEAYPWGLKTLYTESQSEET